jgi:hypothetical protein
MVANDKPFRTDGNRLQPAVWRRLPRTNRHSLRRILRVIVLCVPVPSPLHGSPFAQPASRKFGLYPFSVSSWTESKAAASRALTSRTADHSRENYPPVSRRSFLLKVFHQSSYHPWVCSVPDTTKLMTRCGVSEIRYICSRLAPTKNLPFPSFPKRGFKIPLPKRERQVFALCAWLRAPCSNVLSTPSTRS